MDRSGCSILIVDDERHVRASLQEFLLREGFTVHMAENGEKALKLCSRQSFDFVLMDVRMPGMDGLEALRVLRRWRTGCRVIMMSGYGMGGLEATLLHEGALAFLRKPLEGLQLLALLDARESALARQARG
jgi:two-component system response regulator (stage 0 sporulation protein F)